MPVCRRPTKLQLIEPDAFNLQYLAFSRAMPSSSAQNTLAVGSSKEGTIPLQRPLFKRVVQLFEQIPHDFISAYLVFCAMVASGFAKTEASNFGFSTTFSTVIFSTGTGVSRSPVAVLVTGRTWVSRTKGIIRPLTWR